MRDEKRDYEIKRCLNYEIWETLPIRDQMRKISDGENRASIYLLEAALAEETDYSQDEVRTLLKRAIHDSYLELTDEWVTLAREYQYESISPWDDETE